MTSADNIELGILAVSVLGAAGSFMYNLFVMTRWATRIEESQVTLNNGFESLQGEVSKLAENMNKMDNWMSGLEQRMLVAQSTQSSLIEVERRVRAVEERLTRLETLVQLDRPK